MEIDFRKEFQNMKAFGYNAKEEVKIEIPNAKALLKQGLEAFVGKDYAWLTAYDEVAEWMTNNRGKGLMMYGSCGVGKTLLCYNIIPVLIHKMTDLIVKPYQMEYVNKHIDEVVSKALIYLDDVGTEQSSVVYGQRREAFPEIVDAAERDSKLLILTTNLTMAQLKERYGERTLDRLIGLVKPVMVKGNSMRR